MNENKRNYTLRIKEENRPKIGQEILPKDKKKLKEKKQIAKAVNFKTGFRKISPRLRRSLSRLMAVQILYQKDFFNGEENMEKIKEDIIENYTLDAEKNLKSYRKKIDADFLNNLLSGIVLDEGKIDAEISEFLNEGRNFAEIDDVIKQILRLGTFELKFMKDIPFKIVIVEYADIAGSFFDSKKTSFINATLENLARRFRAEELEKGRS